MTVFPGKNCPWIKKQLLILNESDKSGNRLTFSVSVHWEEGGPYGFASQSFGCFAIIFCLLPALHQRSEIRKAAVFCP